MTSTAGCSRCRRPAPRSPPRPPRGTRRRHPRAAAARIASCTVPSGRGGVHSETSGTPTARRATRSSGRRTRGAPGRRARSSRRAPSAPRSRARARHSARAPHLRPAGCRARRRSGRGPLPRAAQVGVEPRERRRRLGRRNREIGDAAPVEALGEVADRGVAALAHVGDDRGDGLAHAAAGRRRSRRRGAQVGGTAEIDTSQHGERLIVPAGTRSTPKLRGSANPRPRD